MQAFGLLIERHHPTALSFAYRLLGDSDQARDVAQESFLRVLKGARRYAPRGAFTTFLFTIVRNLCREMHRRRSRRRETPFDLAGGNAIAGNPESPDDRLARQDLGRRLREALDQLPEEQRATFLLSEIEGLSYREIGAVCECPVGTVASRKHKAVVQLRRMLAPREDF